MKKLLFLLATVGMIFTACEAGGGLDEGGNGTPTQSNKIATIEEQGANITATIATLQTTKSAVEATIASLKASEEPATRGNDNGNNGVKTMIAALEERVEALEQMISNLTGYTQGDLTEMQDWATATFATMEQYNALASELATLKAAIAEIEGVSTAELSEALAASKESMKQWVNEQLAGYATIADVEAQIAVLTASLTEELKAEVEKVVATLTALMNDTKQEYEKAITDAIQNQGIINEQIAKDIADINKRIDEELATINKRLDDIEKRLDEIEEVLANLIKQIQSLENIDSNGDEPTPVVTSAEATTVQLNFRVSPSKAAGELAANWREFVKVKAYYTDDINTIVDLPITSYIGNGETGIISIEVSGENLSDKFYTDLQQASLYLKISDGNNDRESQSVAIKAQRWMREDVDLVPNNNEIYYTSADGNAIIPKNVDVFGATLQSNLYDWKKGVFVLKFDGKVTSVGTQAFYYNSNITTETNATLRQLKFMMLPNSVTSLGNQAFRLTTIANIRLSENLISIGQLAFNNCHSLISITIPDSVTSVGKDAFSYCGSLQKFYGKFASKDNCCLVVDGVLHRTISKFPTSEYTLPEEVKLFGDGCIYIKTSNFSLTIPDSVEGLDKNTRTVTESSSYIGRLKGKFIVDSRSMVVDGVLCGVAGYKLANYKMPEGVTTVAQMLLYNCRYLKEVWLPKSVKEIQASAFKDCLNLGHVYCQAIEPPQTGLSNGEANIFNGIETPPIIYVPRESLAKYQQSKYWKAYADKLVPYDF